MKGGRRNCISQHLGEVKIKQWTEGWLGFLVFLEARPPAGLDSETLHAQMNDGA